MKLYSVECFGTEFSMYLSDDYTKIEDVQIDILTNYIGENPFPSAQKQIKTTIKILFDNNLITKEDLEKAVPFKKIKQKTERRKMTAHE